MSRADIVVAMGRSDAVRGLAPSSIGVVLIFQGTFESAGCLWDVTQQSGELFEVDVRMLFAGR